MAQTRPPHTPKGRRGRSDDGNAFFADPAGGRAVVPDEMAEELAEEFLSSATSGHEQSGQAHESFVEDESGGSFIITSARTEFAHGDAGFDDFQAEAYPTSGPPRSTPSPDDVEPNDDFDE